MGIPMMILCQKCRQPLREDDEITFTGRAFYHELGSKVSYSITKPHDADPDTFAHVDCFEGDRT